MEKNAILAFVLSMAVFAAYFLLFAPEEPAKPHQDKTAKTVSAQKESPPALSSPGPAAPAATPKTQEAASSQTARDVLVKTKQFEAVFSEQGGTLKSHKLTAYKEQLGGKDLKEIIWADQPSAFPLQLEWIKKSQPDMALAPFKADKNSLILSPDQPKGTLSFTWTSSQGMTIVKTYTLSYDSYRIDLDIQVINGTSQTLDDNLTLLLENKFVQASDNSASFQGALHLVNGQYKEVALGKVDKEEVLTGKIRWGALADTYFMGTVVPLEEQQTVSLKVSKPAPELLKIAFVSAPWTLAPKGEKRIRYALYFGPRDTQILQPLGLELEKAVNFGFFDIIAKPLLWVLRFFNGFLHNYGWSIIILTILVKILFWPLTHKSYKSMKDMQKLQPKIAKLKEKHKDNREKLNQETMALYKTYKVNPMGGCLPMVIQIPVFFALYSLLGYAIELRHAPFFLWINDLSAPDRLPIGIQIPYVGNGIPVLTLLMGASMFIQQKMTPTTGDPTQAKMMLFLPVVFTFMFINFAAGLVLYWLVNNVLSIGQQYYINKYVN
ncbi:MAG: membrane protein insertase YidC [Deltaproteobacteria bacterium]|nr:membrane protein insertase YidC [Deltaproteobacteria bacterium]